MKDKIKSIRDKWYEDCLVLNIPVSPSDVEDIIEELIEGVGSLSPLTSVGYPPMPFDIGDTVYYLQKISDKGGHPGYKIIKCFCYGYFNFGNGWKIKLRTNRYRFKFDEYEVSVTDVGHKVFYNKTDIEDRLKDINGFAIE